MEQQSQSLKTYFQDGRMFIPLSDNDSVSFTWDTIKQKLFAREPLENDDQCTLLLDRLVQHACDSFTLAQDIVDPFTKRPAKMSEDPCGLVQSATLSASHKLRLQAHAYDTETMLYKPTYGHVGVTITLQTNDGEKPFLFDPTFSQFCADQQNGEVYDSDNPRPGFYLQESPQVYNALLQKGYVELDETAADIYLRSFNGGEPPHDNALKILTNPPYSKYNNIYGAHLDDFDIQPQL
tara:strand:- start:1910 stop:2620 length:711 start_codon:yes stop_codon:yes gene_type:complete